MNDARLVATSALGALYAIVCWQVWLHYDTTLGGTLASLPVVILVVAYMHWEDQQEKRRRVERREAEATGGDQ